MKNGSNKMKTVLLFVALLVTSNALFALVYIGDLNTNQFDTNSVNNQFGIYGSPYGPLSINNKFGRYGNQYSNYSATNPYAMFPPLLYDSNGTYMGKLSANTFDSESVSNPLSIYGIMVKSSYYTTIISIYGQ
jgi:hypothetical protein